MALTRITSDVADIANLTVALAADVTAGGLGLTKAPKASPTFTGAVTLSTGNNTTPFNSAMILNDQTNSLQINSTSGSTGDSGMAMMAFNVTGAYGVKMGLRNDGSFGVGGWSRAAWSWYTDASGNMVSAGNVTAYSDPRLKENIVNITGALDKVTALNGVKFTWKQNSLVGIPGSEDYGILANEVKAMAPELIIPSIKDEDGISYDTVAYSKLIPFLIEAIKELKAEVDALKAGV